MPVATEDALLSVDQVLEQLQISRATLQRLRERGELKPANPNPALQRPKVLQFYQSEIDAFLRRRTEQTAQSPESQA